MNKSQRTELYAAAAALRTAKATEKRAGERAKQNPAHWLRTYRKLESALIRYENAKRA
jgi:hypothetical protein